MWRVIRNTVFIIWFSKFCKPYVRAFITLQIYRSVMFIFSRKLIFLCLPLLKIFFFAPPLLKITFLCLPLLKIIFLCLPPFINIFSPSMLNTRWTICCSVMILFAELEEQMIFRGTAMNFWVKNIKNNEKSYLLMSNVSVPPRSSICKGFWKIYTPSNSALFSSI